jgi:divalent metal cation (Fe/Co/Zn/Cd) transporter
VHTHIEPLSGPEVVRGEAGAAAGAADAVRRVAREVSGAEAREVRLVGTGRGTVAYVTLALGAERTLAEAHERAGEVRRRVRREVPGVADAFVHTEP